MSIQLYSSPMKYKDPNTGNYIDIIGISGNPGRGIASVELNNDYTLTITFTDGTSTTTNSIRGAQGVGIQSVTKTGTSGLVDTYTITFDDNTTSTFQVTNGASIDLHICAQEEYDSTTRVPTIQSPDSRTFYLVPNEDSAAPNAYTEWLYADGAWERFGAQIIDLSGYALSADIPVVKGSGVDSVQNKQSGSFVTGVASGNYSIAVGQNVHATGSYSAAFGCSATEASGIGSFATGWGARAFGTAAQAEGSGRATAPYSHAEGLKTNAKGSNSHAEGSNTIANGANSHAAGKYNVEDTYSFWPEWVASTSYAVGDKVKITTTVDNETTIKGYICKTANSDTEFTIANWTTDSAMNFAEIIGNGSSSARSNARALDWDGNGHYMGDVYVRANADSSGGTKVATVNDIPSVPVQDVQIDGTSILQNGVANMPKAGASLGVVRINTDRGININNGLIFTNKASSTKIKDGTDKFAAVVPFNTHEATFYGLSKVAGVDLANETVTLGTYPEASKAAIKSMLGVQDGLKVVRLI